MTFTKHLECNALSAALKIIPSHAGPPGRTDDGVPGYFGMLQCSALTWDVANSDAKRWWLSPVSPFFPCPLPDAWIGSTYGEEQGVAGFIRHTQNTLCQKACVHDGGVFGGTSAVMLRCHPSIFGLGEPDQTRWEGQIGQNVGSCFCLN